MSDLIPTTPSRKPHARSALSAAVGMLFVIGVVALAGALRSSAPTPGAAPAEVPSPSGSSGSSGASDPTGGDTAATIRSNPAVDGTPEPAVSPWRQTIPSGLPLDRALPAADGSRDLVVDPPVFGGDCATTPVLGERSDQRDVEALDRDRGRSEGRSLLLYRDDVVAAAAYDRILAWFRGCPPDPARNSSGGLVTATATSLLSTWTSDPTGGGDNTTWWRVVRAGNAVLVTDSTLLLGAGEALDREIAQQGRDIEPLVESLCAFERDGCREPAPRRRLDGLPLAEGYPEHGEHVPDAGRRGPSRELEPLTFEACGRQVGVPPHEDLLRASYATIEDSRDRQAVAFADRDQATAYAASILDLYRDCPREEYDNGYSVAHRVIDADLGDQGGAVTDRGQFGDGRFDIGLQQTLVVRVGTIVLVAHATSEGGGPISPGYTDDETLARLIEDQNRDLVATSARPARSSR